MELAQLEAFVEATEHGSFRRAAKALYLSQPSLSARVRALEQEIGAPLFHRMGRGVRLTEMGKLLLPYAERAVGAAKEGQEVLASARFAVGGVLTIASARAIGTYTLPSILERFKEGHPNIKTHIKVGRSRDVLQMVSEEEVHVGLARFLSHPDIISAHLYDEEIVLVTHPSHRFAAIGAVNIIEVAQEPFILYDPESTYFLLIQEVCREAGIVPRVEMRLDSIDATKHMIELGLGISFLPLSGIRREVEQGLLSVISLEPEHRVVLPTCVLVRRAQYYPEPLQAFLRVLERMYVIDLSSILGELGKAD